MCSVDPGAGQQPDRAPVEPGMHPVAVEFDLVQPIRPVRRVVDQFGELRFHPIRQRRRFGAPSRERFACTGAGHMQQPTIAAALALTLGFIPAQDEHDDFIVPKARLARPAVQRFLAVLDDPVTREALTALDFKI